MTYTMSISISLGSSKAGLVLGAKLFDTNGSLVGSEITEGFAEIGQGNYLWTYSFPTGFRGGVKFYSTASPSVIYAIVSVNPEEIEYIQDLLNTSTTPNEITIEVPHISTPAISIVPNQNTTPLTSIEIKTGVR